MLHSLSSFHAHTKPEAFKQQVARGNLKFGRLCAREAARHARAWRQFKGKKYSWAITFKPRFHSSLWFVCPSRLYL